MDLILSKEQALHGVHDFSPGLHGTLSILRLK
jgi:hypothetical protein